MSEKTKQTFPTSDYKIASWSITNNDGDNSFLSKTHLTRDGVKTCCGTKLDDKVGGRTVVAATAKDIVNGEAYYLRGGEWRPFGGWRNYTLPANKQGGSTWFIDDLREAECCSKCEAATGNWVSFTVDAVLALSDSPTN